VNLFLLWMFYEVFTDKYNKRLCILTIGVAEQSV